MNTQTQNGVSLIEALVSVFILAIVVGFSTPHIQSFFIKADTLAQVTALSNTLLKTKTFALKQNTPISFYTVTNFNDSCILTNNAERWIISRADVTGLCSTPAVDPPFIIEYSDEPSLLSKITTIGTHTYITFNGTGRTNRNELTKWIITPYQNSTCATENPNECYQVNVTSTGIIQSCKLSQVNTEGECP